MQNRRKSLFVIMGRIIQLIPPFFINWVEFFLHKKNIKNFPLIFIVSPPRSGSTLTYQILSRGTKSLCLTNIWNLLYSIPLIGGLLSKKRSNLGISFDSDRGFVPGIFGEAEGLRFWKYWFGQGLEEKDDLILVKRVGYIKKVFGRLIKEDYPFVSGYLGHSFSINNLRKLFPGVIFLYIKRDKLSNIYSMYKTGKDFEWFSLKPKEWEDALKLPIHDRFVWQYNRITEKIEAEIRHADTLIVNYEEICKDPKAFLNKFRLFAIQHGINIELDLNMIPDAFDVSIIDPMLDDNSIRINDILLQDE